MGSELQGFEKEYTEIHHTEVLDGSHKDGCG